MPESDIHKKKRKKNWLILALIFGWIALIWIVTMVKISGNANAQDIVTYDLEDRKSVVTARQRQETRYQKEGAQSEGQRIKSLNEFQKDNQDHLADIQADGREYQSEGQDVLAARDQAAATFEKNGAKHRDRLTPKPQKWWQGWIKKYGPE